MKEFDLSIRLTRVRTQIAPYELAGTEPRSDRTPVRSRDKPFSNYNPPRH